MLFSIMAAPTDISTLEKLLSESDVLTGSSDPGLDHHGYLAWLHYLKCGPALQHPPHLGACRKCSPSAPTRNPLNEYLLVNKTPG